jgi:hypothetical protein
MNTSLQFSHSCTQESAKQTKKRIKQSTSITRAQFEEAVGKEQAVKLEREFGRSIEAMAMYESARGISYSASIANIDYIFTPSQD